MKRARVLLLFVLVTAWIAAQLALGACASVEGLAASDAGALEGGEAGEVDAPPATTSAPPPATTDASSPPKTFTIGGTVDGLGGAGTVTLHLAGQADLAVGDGPFAFATPLADGAASDATATKSPAGLSCAVAGGTGTVSGADVTAVAVHCRSSEARLIGLTTSRGALVPAFDPQVASYTIVEPIPYFGPVVPQPISLTATAPAGATVVISGKTTASGTASDPIDLAIGPNLIDVQVTAADGATVIHYFVTVAERIAYHYVKASNPEEGDGFGFSVATSGDTLVVGAPGEAGASPLVNGSEASHSMSLAGAVYVYRRDASGVWAKEAYVKAPKPAAGAQFGSSVAISGDTLVVGAVDDSAGAPGIDGDLNAAAPMYSGAVDVYVRSGSTWTHQAHLKANQPSDGACFGSAVAIDGDTMVVGEPGNSSAGSGIDGVETGTGDTAAGAVHVYARSGSTWSRQAFLKATVVGTMAQLGWSVGVSGDTLVTGAPGESGGSSLVDGDENDQSRTGSGAAFVFHRTGSAWTREAYLKATYPMTDNSFGYDVAIDASTVVVGAIGESSKSLLVGGDETNTQESSSGAAFVFVRSGATWTKQAYIKASNTHSGAQFGYSVAVKGDVIGVGSPGENSYATLSSGSETDLSCPYCGAAYVYLRGGVTWTKKPGYIKPSSLPGTGPYFGCDVGLAADRLVVGAYSESGGSSLVDGSEAYGISGSGAVWIFGTDGK